MHYVLVHGSWHGSWCWNKIVPLLEQKGHTVECVDLPGYEEVAVSSRVTYQDYYDHVKELLYRCDEPVILVAHSMSGIVVGPLADRMLSRVKHAFFIAAFLPVFGESLLDVAMRYDKSEIPSILEVDSVNKVHLLDPEGAKEVFYHDCSSTLKDWAAAQLRLEQPYGPLETPLDWEDSFKGRDQRTYIVSELDRVVEPRCQRDMLRYHPARVISMNCGHFPFLSKPEELAEIFFQV